MKPSRPEKRRLKIVKMLRAMRKEFFVDELAGMFKVTPLTIRRDLTLLEEEGTVIRTHGGCVAAERALFESAYIEQIHLNYHLKQAIGGQAAEQVKKGSTILISDGSTNFHLAVNLKEVSGLTVYTNSIEMINELSRSRGVDLHVLGGRYKREVHCLGGAMTEQMLEGLKFDIVFVGTDGIDTEGRCLVADTSEARIAHMMIESGRKAILLADHTKVNGKGYTAYGTLADFSMWITTKGVERKLKSKFKKMTKIKEATSME